MLTFIFGSVDKCVSKLNNFLLDSKHINKTEKNESGSICRVLLLSLDILILVPQKRNRNKR